MALENDASEPINAGRQWSDRSDCCLRIDAHHTYTPPNQTNPTPGNRDVIWFRMLVSGRYARSVPGLPTGRALTTGTRRSLGASTGRFPPTRVIARGPRHHSFGYYDKLQFDPTSRYVLGMEVPFADDLAPKDTEIFATDLKTGRSRLIISLADIARLGKIPNGFTSHFIWRDSRHILSQSRNWLGNPNWGDFLFEDREGGRVKEIGHGVLDPSGHLSYLPGNEWILNDTYPKGMNRLQTPHLCQVKTGRRIDLGHFHLPKIYGGEWRVDTHPASVRMPATSASTRPTKTKVDSFASSISAES